MTVASHEVGTDPRLVAIERKLDRVIEQQQAVAELIDGMAPVAKSMLRVGTERFEEMEKRGYFTAARQALDILDKVVTTYGEDDVRALGDNIVAILDTVRSLTQPELLEVAHDASEVIHNADAVEPLGRMGLLRSTGDKDVQRGLTLAVELLRRLGRIESQNAGALRAAPAPERVVAATAVEAPVSVGATRPTTVWEGAEFYDDGFLVDPNTWTPELASKIAAGLGIAFGDPERKVVEWARAEFLEKGASPNVRRVATGSGAGTSALYAMFPKTPGKKIAMVAGIPKPVGCI